MNTRILYWSAAATALVLLLIWKREDIVSTVRGLRNKNPGNVEKGSSWVGLSPDQSGDSRFAVFTEMKYGVRAALKIFRTYQTQHGLKSVAQMVSRWAPPSENNTSAYIDAVAKRVGVSPTVPLNLNDPTIARDFLRAIFRHENGIAAEAIPADVIDAGIKLA
jgi:hypothetical protein